MPATPNGWLLLERKEARYWWIARQNVAFWHRVGRRQPGQVRLGELEMIGPVQQHGERSTCRRMAGFTMRPGSRFVGTVSSELVGELDTRFATAVRRVARASACELKGENHHGQHQNARRHYSESLEHAIP